MKKIFQLMTLSLMILLSATANAQNQSTKNSKKMERTEKLFIYRGDDVEK